MPQIKCSKTDGYQVIIVSRPYLVDYAYNPSEVLVIAFEARMPNSERGIKKARISTLTSSDFVVDFY